MEARKTGLVARGDGETTITLERWLESKGDESCPVQFGIYTLRFGERYGLALSATVAGVESLFVEPNITFYLTQGEAEAQAAKMEISLPPEVLQWILNPPDLN